MKNNRELGPKDKVVKVNHGDNLFIDLNQSVGNAFLVICDKNQKPIIDILMSYDPKGISALLRAGDNSVSIDALNTNPGTGKIQFSVSKRSKR